MLAFTYKLECEDGTPADPPTMRSAVGVTWKPGDTIPLGVGRGFRVIGIRPEGPEDDPVLVVEAA